MEKDERISLKVVRGGSSAVGGNEEIATETLLLGYPWEGSVACPRHVSALKDVCLGRRMVLVLGPRSRNYSG